MGLIPGACIPHHAGLGAWSVWVGPVRHLMNQESLFSFFSDLTWRHWPSSAPVRSLHKAWWTAFCNSRGNRAQSSQTSRSMVSDHKEVEMAPDLQSTLTGTDSSRISCWLWTWQTVPLALPSKPHLENGPNKKLPHRLLWRWTKNWLTRYLETSAGITVSGVVATYY